MTELSDRSARLALAAVVDGGDPEVSGFVVMAGAPEAWARLQGGRFGEPLARRAAEADLAVLVARLEASGIRFVIPEDEEWPDRVQDLRHCEPVQRRGGAPFGFFLRGPGHLAGMLERSVAIVGSRACTAYGGGVASDLAADLAERGVTVISGGAYGIDVAAHRGALSVRGPTVCVLANGVDVSYPRGNAAIVDRIGAEGLLVSELPPGTPPSRTRFLARNRLIAAGAKGTVVVEAAIRSGARNTASWALACHRQLMAVPGPVSSAMSEGPHLMIRNGQAALVTNCDEVLELVSEAGLHPAPLLRGADRDVDRLDPTRMAVFEAVPARRAASAGEVALTAGVPVPVCLAELAALEAAGMVQGSDDGWRVVCR